MENLPFRSVVVPALFISSAVFFGLTFPFALIKSEPVIVELPFFSGEIQPLFDGNNNDKAIPYIGLAILLSAGAGIASVEVNRKRYLFREAQLAKLTKLSNIEITTDEQEAQPEMVVASVSSEDHLSSSENIDFETLVQAFDSVQTLDSALPTLEQQVEPFNLDLSPAPDTNDLAEPALSYVAPAEFAFQDLDLVSHQILESPSQYQTCRIQLPGLQQGLFAIHFEGKYYSFLKAEKTLDRVLEAMAKIESKDYTIVITKTEKTYTMWVLEPEAYQA